MLVRIVFGKLLSGHVLSEGQTLERMAWGKKNCPYDAGGVGRLVVKSYLGNIQIEKALFCKGPLLKGLPLLGSYLVESSAQGLVVASSLLDPNWSGPAQGANSTSLDFKQFSRVAKIVLRAPRQLLALFPAFDRFGLISS